MADIHANSLDPARLAVTTYNPESALRDPRRLFRDMLADLLSSRELTWRLALRDIKAMYRQSMLGYVWAVLPPLAATVTFSLLRSGGAFATTATTIPYPVFVILGTVIWQIIVDAVTNPLRLVINNRAMLTKINFPRESLILAGLVVSLFNAFVRLVLLIPVMWWLDVSPATTAFLLPLGIFSALAFGTCLGLLVAPIGMLYQDVEKAIIMLVGFWMFLTPVVMPRAAEGLASKLMAWNPATPIVECTRNWLVGESNTSLAAFVLVTLTSILLLLIGWVLYRVALPHAIARLGM